VNIFLAVKRPERKADHLSPYGIEVKNCLAPPQFPSTSSSLKASLIKHRDKFTGSGEKSPKQKTNIYTIDNLEGTTGPL
jgi:hypothetical protein